jgi:hypothetical protein
MCAAAAPGFIETERRHLEQELRERLRLPETAKTLEMLNVALARGFSSYLRDQH